MLNLLLGDQRDVDGRNCIETRLGAAGHAIYGDYIDYPAGRYAVEFQLTALANKRFLSRDGVCAALDVVVGNDTAVLARREIMTSELQDGPTRFVLTFRLDRPGRLEFRVGVNGSASLLIDDKRLVVEVPGGIDDPAGLLEGARFPDPADPSAPEFLKAHAGTLRHLFDRGVGVHIEGGDVVLRYGGVAFLARIPDDLNFVGEIFFDNTYNLLSSADTCVIDIGMNTGLVSLMFAARPWVSEVHAFEPFPATYGRALANLAINPDLAGKITPYNVGLSDSDEDGTFLVPDMDASGSMTIRQIGKGTPVSLAIRDAAAMIGPIVEAARARGRAVVIKMDCEGSEFAVFASLAAAGLLDRISAFMVEWHRVDDQKSQIDLIDPLLHHGFIAIDRSPRIGNGFFYAIRALPATAALDMVS